MSFSNSCPFNIDASFEESEPSNTVSCIDCLKKAWRVGLGMGERLGAAPFGEMLNDPVGDVFCSVD